jgi:hypothetical protein
MTLGQRVVIVVGLGAVLLIAGLWWYAGEAWPGAGWLGDGLRSTDTYVVVVRRRWQHLGVPVGLVVLWVVVSVWLLGPSRPAEPSPAPDGVDT